jgi:hypothetical protein
VSAAEIRQPRDHYIRVGDRLLKRCEIDAWIAGRVMCDGRQRVAIGLRDVLSRDSATRLNGPADLFRHHVGRGACVRSKVSGFLRNLRWPVTCGATAGDVVTLLGA